MRLVVGRRIAGVERIFSVVPRQRLGRIQLGVALEAPHIQVVGLAHICLRSLAQAQVSSPLKHADRETGHVPGPTTSVMWFRRDLRLRDHPALAAAADADRVVALFVLDDALRRPSGAPRLAFLYQSLRDLDAELRQHGGELVAPRGTSGWTRRWARSRSSAPVLPTRWPLAASSSPTANRSGSSRRSTGRGRL